VIAALVANGGIAIAKFIAAAISGSVTMLAEAVHSVADTTNQALLLLGMGLSKKQPNSLYPLGREKETYFWAFIVALMLFFLGGVYAIYEGLHTLYGPEKEPGSPLVPLLVLVFSIVIEVGSFIVAIREFNKSRGDRSVAQALFSGKDPTIPLVLLEDAGAVLGLVIALLTVLVSWLTGSNLADGIGSIVIGLLLCFIGVALAHDTRSLLIGEGATPEMKRRAIYTAETVDGVEAVTQLLTLHLGPENVLAAFKVRFRPNMTLAEVEATTDKLEAAVRGDLPAMKRVFVEPDSDYIDAKPHE
jgi:cation diffusion facilitator family transporter